MYMYANETAVKRGHSQVKLTAFLSNSDAIVQLIDEGDWSTEKVMKKAKHNSGGLHYAWNNEFTWVYMDEDEEGQGMFVHSTIKIARQLKG